MLRIKCRIYPVFLSKAALYPDLLNKYANIGEGARPTALDAQKNPGRYRHYFLNLLPSTPEKAPPLRHRTPRRRRSEV
ncbi:UNVERIFIED_CONTAM: hypothetical protein K2H54_055814 [Gekko kuhli]